MSQIIVVVATLAFESVKVANNKSEVFQTYTPVQTMLGKSRINIFHTLPSEIC
jgi:hypothetical protein